MSSVLVPASRALCQEVGYRAAGREGALLAWGWTRDDVDIEIVI